MLSGKRGKQHSRACRMRIAEEMKEKEDEGYEEGTGGQNESELSDRDFRLMAEASKARVEDEGWIPDPDRFLLLTLEFRLESRMLASNFSMLAAIMPLFVTWGSSGL